MTTQFSPYPSILQFRHVIKYATYYPRDDYKIDYIGTVKLHGTHTDIVQDEYSDIVVQSRNRIITPESDNLGFANFVDKLSDIKGLFKKVRETIGQDAKHIMICGEWCGRGIQKGVALAKVPPMWVIFDIKVDGRWVNMLDFSHIQDNEQNIYNILQFKTWRLTIDFKDYDKVQEAMIEITNDVEKECPVGLYFGVKNGVGEGVVWRPVETNKYPSSQYWFKTKGQKHSVSRVAVLKQLAPTNVELFDNMNNFVDTMVTDNRCNQGLSIIKETEQSISMKNLGQFMQWIANDIRKEEYDTIEENGWDVKISDLNKMINVKSKTWFMMNAVGQSS
jgi:RNA ligase